MKAAHDAPQVPLLDRDIFHGGVGTADAGLEKDKQVDPGYRHNPEIKERQGPQLIHGVPGRSEYF